MLRRLAAPAAWVAALCAPWATQAAPPSSVPSQDASASSASTIASLPAAPAPLRDAIRDAWRRHPSSAATDAQLAAARARLVAAEQPLYNPEATFDAENQGRERTVTGGLSLTLDIRNKRGARRDAAQAHGCLPAHGARLARPRGPARGRGKNLREFPLGKSGGAAPELDSRIGRWNPHSVRVGSGSKTRTPCGFHLQSGGFIAV